MRGQAYDGAGAMSGAVKGAAARIMAQCPKAHYVHCAAHRLNLCVVKCCTICEVSNAMDCADSVVRFFKFSPKRQTFLEKCIDMRTCLEVVIMRNGRSLKNSATLAGWSDMIHLRYLLTCTSH